MGIAERRERERERLRTRILEAARDILSEEGLDALSMRAIAERIEYSPATIYLYFRDKDALIGSVVEQAFRRLGEYMEREMRRVGADADPVERYTSLGRAYVRFALENTAYFRVMFELPTDATVEAPEPSAGSAALRREVSWEHAVVTLQEAMDDGLIEIPDPFRGAVMGWGLLHGLVSLFLGGHLAGLAETREEFEALVEDAVVWLHRGWSADRSADRSVPAGR